ncbi:SCO family protein [Pseudomonas nitroreducens]|uniref:SCO family protein n=1 Tax=Pseudomonas nitroreducens TaxID=46680 RepID=UPI00209FF63F|nr:SCO family protein [Pseudomonas nitroreducens]MCP1626795.1 protein SCO1/2 [Pseudomonas nitroreducens]
MRWILILALYAGVSVAATRSDVGGPFNLTNQDGQRVTQRDYEGRPALLYFGFTSCPDICPTDLAKMARIAHAVEEEKGIKPRPIFVTLDPERDTPQQLKGYVGHFDPEFVGLTGTPQEIIAITDEYHVFYKKVPYGDKPGDYTVDHSTFLFLLDKDGSYLDHFRRGMAEDEIIQRVGAKLTP